MKKSFYIVAIIASTLVSFSCNKKTEEKPVNDFSPVQEVIAQAEDMTLEELCKKAIAESNGATIKGIGNSSRGKTAGAAFIKYLTAIDPSYNGKIEWSQPKNNSIFTTLNVDYKSANPEYFMTLIQDGNQIESKMMETKILRTFIPKEWAQANGLSKSQYPELLPLQTLNKVFMYNNVSGKKFDNCWEFVEPGRSGLYMDVNSELVGKNFLYMLTSDKYSTWLKKAFDKLPVSRQALFNETISECEKVAENFKLTAPNAKYGLAFIKLWVSNYTANIDDGPICNELVLNSSANKFGLLVYSKLRSVTETSSSSLNNISVAAYETGYTGIGGYGYCHYLELMDSSPYPWTACAFISFMVNTVEGFEAWGRDMGGYSANPSLAIKNEAKFHHSTAGGTEFPVKNDRGFDWWTAEGCGELVIEDPKYCAKVSADLGDWIDIVRAGR